MTISETLSPEVQALVRTHIESYEHLLMLLLAYREPMRYWSVAELAGALAIPAQLAEAAAIRLSTAGLLHAVPSSESVSYAYSAASATHAAVVRLASEYTGNPAAVIKLLNANAIERVRTSALRAFAEAFVLKKKDGDGG